MFNWFRKPQAETAAPPGAQAERTAPLTSDEHKARGNALFADGRLDEAAGCYREAIMADGRNAAAHYNLGLVLHAGGQLDEAVAAFTLAWHTDPTMADAQKMLGAVRHAQGDLLGAVSHFRLALATDASCGAHGELCMALFQQGDVDEAARVIAEGLALQPDNAAFHAFQGNLQVHFRRHVGAVDSYRRAIALQPGDAQVWHNLGITLAAQRKWADAVQAFAMTLQLPGGATPKVHNDLGLALSSQTRYEEALASFNRALALDPAYVDAMSNAAMMLGLLKRREEALQAFERLVDTAPAHDYALGFLLGARRHACDWAGGDSLLSRAEEAVLAGQKAVVPFAWLAMSHSPQSQLECSRTYAADNYPAEPVPVWQGERYAHERIRVAYLSADFHDHATAYLMAELFELHDQARFETIALSFGPIKTGAMRERLERAFSRFIEVGDKSDHEIALLMRELEVDIAVDLKGYTTDARTGIFAHRAAPVQVNYIGYPGTMGVDYIDYIIGDTQVLQPEDEAFYTEKLVRLPGSYQVNDGKRRIAEVTPTRAEQQLPEGAFVFCCFNNNYKITPDVFDVWMRLLQQVPGSVLWLLEDNPLAARNLRREAEVRGVSGGRIIFAGRAPLDQHLARQRLADLFLDTQPYNAHTTASDALWAGLPVLTCRGGVFPARVAASLLHAVGLPELVTHNLQDYEALALKLATTPALLKGLRDKLAANRLSSALFDADRFRRNIESAYVTMWRRSESGEAPASFDVAEQVPSPSGGGLGWGHA